MRTAIFVNMLAYSAYCILQPLLIIEKYAVKMRKFLAGTGLNNLTYEGKTAALGDKKVAL